MNPTLPKNMHLTPPGATNAPRARFFPRVKGGVCEACGVIDPNLPGHVQYKLCPHYKGMELKCIYCKQTADHEDVVRMSDMLIHEHPYRPGQLVTLCGRYECDRAYKRDFGLQN